MQRVVIDQPYRFAPPYHGTCWARLLQCYLPRYLRKSYGLDRVECRGVERLSQSLKAGHGVLLAPNHPRPCDPMVMGMLTVRVKQPFFAMASWHLFAEGGFRRWILRRMGAFSIFREGMDRAAINAAIEILETASRPLVIFPEGTVSRTNDRLFDLMEGTTFIARAAAKKREKNNGGKVVVHPVAIKYFFDGDIRATLAPVLTSIEQRLTWRPQGDLPLIDRIYKVGTALLGLKETEYLGEPSHGGFAERLDYLIDALLTPIEEEWSHEDHCGHVVARVKRLRMAILPQMIAGGLDQAEMDRRWRQLADMYLAQQLSCYPPDYVRSRADPERLLETVERFEEDLTDEARIHPPMRAVVEVGAPLEVPTKRPPKGQMDPLLQQIGENLTEMIRALRDEVRGGECDT